MTAWRKNLFAHFTDALVVVHEMYRRSSSTERSSSILQADTNVIAEAFEAVIGAMYQVRLP